LSREEIRSLVERARRSLRSARYVLGAGDNDFAIARAYYAMFYAAMAALLTRGVRRSKHSAVIAAFGETFVKTGQLDRRHHEAFHAAFEGRSEADYGVRFPSRDEVDQVLRQADELIDAVVGLVRSDGFDV
jgi:uncharacterized protein (UPF0332 family)